MFFACFFRVSVSNNKSTINNTIYITYLYILVFSIMYRYTIYIIEIITPYINIGLLIILLSLSIPAISMINVKYRTKKIYSIIFVDSKL